MNPYVVLKQITAIAMPDQVGFMQQHLAGLDTSGRVWIAHPDGRWALFGNPTVETTPLSTPENSL